GAILAFLAKAKDPSFALHAAVYEFQKPELLAGLKEAAERGAEVKVAYHARHKGGADKTLAKNEAAIKAADFGKKVELVARKANLTPVSLLLSAEHKITPIFSPQSNDTMLHLYSSLCDDARCVIVSAPFAVSPIVLAALAKKRDDVLRYLLLDKTSSLGKGEE